MEDWIKQIALVVGIVVGVERLVSKYWSEIIVGVRIVGIVLITAVVLHALGMLF